MEKESKSAAWNLSGNGLVALVIVATGAVIVRQPPLEATRPPVNEPRLEQHFSYQDIDARLWQDPFSAIERGRAEARKKDAEKAALDELSRTADNLAREIKTRLAKRADEEKKRLDTKTPRSAQPARERVEILAVMLSGGPHADDVETRRRARYAVMAGLNAKQLAPDDPEHMGYFIPQHPATTKAPEKLHTHGHRLLPDIVPYEWFGPAADIRRRNGDDSPPLVLVMWLQSEAFARQPLHRLAQLAQAFENDRVRWRVLGPSGSDGLRAMVEEAAGSGGLPESLKAMDIRFYSPYATVPDKGVLADVALTSRDQSVAGLLAARNVQLERTIGDDAKLVSGLIEELKLRGLRPATLPRTEGESEWDTYGALCKEPRTPDVRAPSHVAVVAEWDALYGRGLRRDFRATSSKAGFCVSAFNYVRGLDGQLPAGGDMAPSSGTAGKPNQPDKDVARRQDGSFVERAEGQSQFDYLRRLAVQMRALDAQLRRTSADGRGLRAIGLLGNDVHDKLLALQALQPEFPTTLFFTTDLDARFLHPREQAWARNLIVASNFGLRLKDDLQNGTPPFRDSYQTSVYLATLFALNETSRESTPPSKDQIAGWFAAPRIFEIGRTAAFDFSIGASDAEPHEPADAGCRKRDLGQCKTIHPPGSPMVPESSTLMRALIFSLLALALWGPVLAVSRGMKKALSRFVGAPPTLHAKLLRYGLLFAALALVQIALPYWLAQQWPAFTAWLTAGGKPLLLSEGISLWPTEAIRVFTLLLCIYLIARGSLLLTYNIDNISPKFLLEWPREWVLAELKAASINDKWWQKLAAMFRKEFVRAPDSVPPSPYGLPAIAVLFWSRYIAQSRPGARLARTSAYTAVALALTWLLMQAFGEDYFVPQRGELSRTVHDWLGRATLVATYFLIFFVVDATVFCVRFVHGLRERQDNWPDLTLNEFERKLGVPREHLDNWIDLEFVAMRTRCVTGLIYYPFIVLSLMLLSKSTAFDHWYLASSRLVLTSVGAAIAFGCAVALRRAAEASRRRALEQVDDKLVRANAKTSQAGARLDVRVTATQLELLRTRIENLHEGAFAPFWQQPLLKAVLLPFATLGGTTMLDYMALANL